MIEFSFAEVLLVEMALRHYMTVEMCQSDRNICEQAYMKLQLSRVGKKIRKMLAEQGDD